MYRLLSYFVIFECFWDLFFFMNLQEDRYGVLFRGFQNMVTQVMAKEFWFCMSAICAAEHSVLPQLDRSSTVAHAGDVKSLHDITCIWDKCKSLWKLTSTHFFFNISFTVLLYISYPFSRAPSTLLCPLLPCPPLSSPPCLSPHLPHFSVAPSQANNQLINQLSPRIIVAALRGAL